MLGGDIGVAWPGSKSGISKRGAVRDGLRREQPSTGPPVDEMTLKYGSMLVSDDRAGAIYRISYGGK